MTERKRRVNKPVDKDVPQEVVVEKSMGGYHLPDHAIDLSSWLRDGLEVYNLFVVMKPMFFQMLKAHGGEFRMSWGEAAKQQMALKQRVTFKHETVGTPGEPGYDAVDTAILTEVE